MTDTGALTKRILKVRVKNFSYSFNHIFFLQESARLIQEPVPGIEAIVDDHNPRYFKVIIDGPSEVHSSL
jgi:hypothetical protein